MSADAEATGLLSSCGSTARGTAQGSRSSKGCLSFTAPWSCALLRARHIQRMPTALSHPAVPLAIGLGAGRAAVSGPLLLAGVTASVLPDLDVIAFRLGVPYSAEFGHRGFSHSLAFAALVALVGGSCHRMLRARFLSAFAFLFAATASPGALDAFTTGGLGGAFRSALVALVGGSCHRMLRARFLSAFAFLFAATASHGALDAFTTGGLGVAFFWPFSLERHFAPLRVIRVAPFQVGRLLSGRGVAILLSEALWVWLPCAALAAALAWTRRRGGASLPGRTGGRGAAS